MEAADFTGASKKNSRRFKLELKAGFIKGSKLYVGDKCTGDKFATDKYKCHQHEERGLKMMKPTAKCVRNIECKYAKSIIYDAKSLGKMILEYLLE